ncbi:hypothetical protein R1flu_028903 [Riccia fluitans]|uniref:Uncharacterized protein n=1 Tax=Riccia fluitans TaxID=41844 RepID=A0ABD1XNK3_9MARC
MSRQEQEGVQGMRRMRLSTDKYTKSPTDYGSDIDTGETQRIEGEQILEKSFRTAAITAFTATRPCDAVAKLKNPPSQSRSTQGEASTQETGTKRHGRRPIDDLRGLWISHFILVLC